MKITLYALLLAAVILGGTVAAVWMWFRTDIGQLGHSPDNSSMKPPSPDQFANYIIFIDAADSNKIKAKNGLTGAIDYSGTDARVVIQSAVTALSSGGSIFISAGTYSISYNINLASNIHIFGQGTSTILKLPNNHNTTIQYWRIFSAEPSSNVTIEKMELDGNYVNNMGASPEHWMGLITILGGNDWLIRNCNIHGGRWYGIHAYSSSNIRNVKVLECSFKANVANHVTFWSSSRSTVSNCSVKNCYFDGLPADKTGQSDVAISVGTDTPANPSTNIIIESNVINGAYGTGSLGLAQNGITIEGGKYCQVISNNVYNCSIGIAVQGGGGHNIIADNIIWTKYWPSGANSLAVLTGQHNNTITGNKIYGAPAGKTDAIWIQSNNNLIANNYVTRTADVYLSISDEGAYNKWYNNQFEYIWSLSIPATADWKGNSVLRRD